MTTSQALGWLEKAKALEKWPLARLVSLFETDTPEARKARQQVMEKLEKENQARTPALVIGITGTPGAGKSSLIAGLCSKLLKQHQQLKVAVLAVDPSSQSSGGSLLGDRTRMQLPSSEKRLFFRSQASALDLGGVGKKSFQVTRLLRQLFDLVIIETVGIGQSEIEVDHLADYNFLVMQPLAGDQVQFMKAGIMEVPDSFIINKCDEDALAKKSYHLLKSSLKLMHVYIDEEGSETRKIFLTSATKDKGIDVLAEFILQLANQPASRKSNVDRETYYLKKQLQLALGDYGIRLCKGLLEPAVPSNLSDISTSTFEKREASLRSLINQHIPQFEW